MSFGKLTTSSKKITGINSTFHLFISRNNLRPSATTFEGYEVSPLIYKNNGLVHCSPVELMRLFYTIQFIVYNSNLATIDPAKYEGDLSNYCYLDTNSRMQPRIEQYVQVMKRADGSVFGLLYSYAIRDPSFNFNLALDNYWILEAKRARRDKAVKRANMLPPPDVRVCRFKSEYVRDTLSPYLDERFSDEDISCANLSGNFIDASDPTQPHNCLTLAHALELIRRYHPDAPAVYTNPGLYRVRVQDENEANPEADEDAMDVLDHADFQPANAEALNEPEILPAGTERHITFPLGAHYVSHSSRNPVIASKMEIINPIIIHTGDPAAQRTARLLAAEKQALPDPDYSVLREAQFISARDYFAKASAGKTPSEYYKFLHEPKSIELLISLLYIKNNNPHGEAYMKWSTAQREKNPNWSLVHPPMGNVDNSLSFFANCLARDLYMQEHVGTVTIHREIALLTLLATIASDVQDFKLRFHVLFTGPPAGGKSHGLTELMEMSIPGTVYETSSQSRKALTTSRCMNGLVNTFDELPENFTSDGDGSGNPLEKTALSKGRRA
jgi:hypothetical protein